MWLEIISLLVGGLALLLFILFQYFKRMDDYWTKREVPTLTNGEMGSFMEKLKLPFHEIDIRAYRGFQAKSTIPIRYGGLVELAKPMVFILDPDLIKNILVKDFDHFVNRRGINLKEVDKYFHKMLFNMEDEPWKELRATMSPTFTTGKIKQMFAIFNASSQKFVTYLQKQIGEENNSTGYEMDMRDPCGRLTMDVIASAAFGIDSQNFASESTMFTKMSQRFMKSSEFSPSLMIKIVLILTAPKIGKLIGFTFFDRMAMEFFAHAVKQSISEREKNPGEKRNDFLQLMLEAKKEVELEDQNNSGKSEKKAKLTEELILAQCVLFFLAGMDTTESLLIFASYELAMNPDVQKKLYEEVDASLKDNSGKLSYESVNTMSYLDMVVSETLRKYPPVVRLDRRANQPYVESGSGLTWEKDTIAVIPTYAIHYDPNIYPEPEKFLPERFTVENKAKRHAYTYMPFGLGPRSCIAMRFALTEGKTALAHLVHSFQLEPSPKTPAPLTYLKGTTLKPKDGLWLNVKPRNSLN